MIDDIGASVAGSIASSLSGALGSSASGGLGASVSAAANLAASASASGAANLAASAIVSAATSLALPPTISAPSGLAADPLRPADPWLVFRFLVVIEGLGPVSFQKVTGIKATMQSSVPPPAPPPAPPAPAPAHGANTSTRTPPPVHSTTAPNGGQSGGITQLPGTNWTWGDITLSRGMANDGKLLWTWLLEAVTGHPTPKSVTIQLFDNEGRPTVTWYIKKAYPSSWTFPTLDATAGANNSVAIESLNLKILNPQDVTVTIV
jgi:phage tail-like protein